MIKKSIARNHLSEAAKEGRYGDNILVHMSKNEADVLAKASGFEKLPINPKTGLPEAFIFAAAAAISAGVGAYSAWKGGKEQNKQASTQSKLMAQQQQGIEESLNSLEGVKDSKEAVSMQEYSEGIGNLSAQTGQSKEDLQQNYQNIIQKSGFATAGSATTKNSQMYKRIQNQFGSGSNSLLGNLGKNMAGVEEWYEGEKSRLTSEKKRLSLQKNLADEQSSSWYLGKNIQKALGG